MLTVRHLQAGYPGKHVLKDISLDVADGSLHVLVGRNGCGKSTLLKTLTGTIRTTGGSAELHGQDLLTMPSRTRAQMLGYLPQTHSLPEMTVYELAEGGRYPWLGVSRMLTQRDRDAVERALVLTDCMGYADRIAAQLSGGELQRACLAMLFAQEAGFLMLDEPTTHLDASAAFSLMKLLRSCCQPGRNSVLCVLHDLPLALRYADTVSVLHDGEICFIGTPEEFAASSVPQDVFQVRLIRAEKKSWVISPLDD